MLQFKVVDQPTLDLLIKISNSSLFSNYRLVGGTALALIYGHRKSIDLDFFGTDKINSDEMLEFFKSIGSVREFKNSKKIDSLFLDNVKIDIVNYPYDWIDEPLLAHKIKLASAKEIAAMKIAAIINRGTKKDFIDLNELLKIFSFQQIFEFYLKKFTDSSLFFALKSVIFFDDADEQEMPYMFSDITWQTVKENIKKLHADYVLNVEGQSA
jgi:predicted nucleotidyltransferase component of viral defense system